MEDEPIYIQVSKEIQDLLSKREDFDLGKAVKAELESRGHTIDTKFDRDPTSTEPDRELFLVILAGAVAATMVGSAVAKVIDALSRSKHAEFVERELYPALDGKGNPILDRNGNPVFTAKEKPGPSPHGEISTAEVKAGKLLQFKFTSGGTKTKS